MKEEKINGTIDFFIRAILGMAIIFVMNGCMPMYGINVKLGINLLNFLVSGFLGVPGLGLLYGITLYQMF